MQRLSTAAMPWRRCVPGAISVQVAAFIGLQMRGLAGAAAACTGYILPAFLFMLGLSALYEHWHNAAAAAAGFSGLRAVVIGILGHAALVSGRDVYKKQQRQSALPSARRCFSASA